MTIYYSRIYILCGLFILSTYLIYPAAKITQISTPSLEELNSELIKTIIAKNKNTDKVISLLNKGASVNATSRRSTPALNIAITKKSWPIVELLLNDNRLDVNAVDRKKITALHIAAEWPNVLTFESLISKGANINAKCDEGQTPLMYAVSSRMSNGFVEQVQGKYIIETLILAGADINAVNKNGYTALKGAILNADPQIVKILLEAGANIYEGAIENAEILNSSEYFIKNKQKILELLTAEPARRAAVLEKWNEQVTKQIKPATRLIPELNKIISEYVTTEKYEDIPIDYRLSNIS